MSSALLQSPRAVLHSSESQEWYTRQPISDAARRVLGRIDLDPASSPAANEIVCAGHYFTPADDGLAQRWYGRVWLNPPYGKTGNKSNQEIWAQQLLAEYRAGNVREAILLVNAATDTTWFRALWDYPICFPTGRIKFWRPGAPADY
ncbi:MAG: phage N-6-adenine-methyltransferase [Chloroflexota bacterium]|nr:phage N-6-adenine-methyltransferase [Chloroflexota bacterium]